MQRQRQSVWPILPYMPIPSPPPLSHVVPCPPELVEGPIYINYDPPSPPGPPGPPGPAGPPGPQGPPGTVGNVPVTLIDQDTYSANTDEYFLGVIYDGSVTVTLPTGTLGKVFIVKDSIGDAENNPITVTTTGSTIDGLSSYSVNLNWASIGLLYNGIEWNVV